MTTSTRTGRWILAAVALELATMAVATAAPINWGVDAPTPDVFHNYWVPPVPAGSAPGFGAQLYVAPRPVPPHVGHTWYTYPPFMPHAARVPLQTPPQVRPPCRRHRPADGRPRPLVVSPAPRSLRGFPR